MVPLLHWGVESNRGSTWGGGQPFSLIARDYGECRYCWWYTAHGMIIGPSIDLVIGIVTLDDRYSVGGYCADCGVRVTAKPQPTYQWFVEWGPYGLDVISACGKSV